MVIGVGEGRLEIEGEGGVVEIHDHVGGIPADEGCGIIVLESEIGSGVVRVGVWGREGVPVSTRIPAQR